MNSLRKLVGTIVLVAAVAAAASAAPVHKALAPITTSSGAVAGMVLPSGVKAWYGVPFAKPPTGALRWQPPQPISWQGVWNADRKGAECMQVLRPHGINHYFGEEATSEDCLYLNIWAPQSAGATSKLPVVVFIYGGGYTIGSSGSPLYAGENVARNNAVFVNFNYRVGVLGFLSHPELTAEQGGHSGNYAFLDQVAALKWVHDNIARFGGDPSRVVIMGQSAGAGSVVQQTFSPLAKGLFRGAVMSSGCNWEGAQTSLADGERNGLEIQKRLNAASLAEMRDIPADRIIALQNESQVGVNVNTGVRAGAVIDGWFMPKAPLDLLRAGQANDVALIAGFNQDEAVSALMNATSVEDYAAIARRMYGADADAFLKLYPVSSTADIKRVGGQVARESGLENNARTCAQLQSQHHKSPLWINQFSRRHSYAPGAKIADQDLSTIGAYHTADIPFWFGNLDVFNSLRTTRAWTADDRALSSAMMGSLIAFAATGNPQTAAVQWPAWTAGNEVKVEFGTAAPAAMVKLNVAGLTWLKAHPPQAVTAAPGTGGRVGNGPRD
ncbi:MAG: carboxylesterase family protein [Proteobacteria bacterium]|nr:carboxylesterase family protein [Pseudomonadota bacterium]